MTVAQRTFHAVHHVLGFGLGLLQLGEVDDHERDGEDGHGDDQQRLYRFHGGLLGGLANQHADEHGGQRCGQ